MTSTPDPAGSPPQPTPTRSHVLLNSAIVGGCAVVAAVASALITANAVRPSGGPPSISIEDTGGTRVVRELDDYSGAVRDLQPGQAVWLFTQQQSRDGQGGYEAGGVYATTGPCPVNEGVWRCSAVGVGGPDSADTPGTYRVWAAVIDDRTQFDVVQRLRQNGALMRETSRPPDNLVMDEITVRRN